jgi:hypothetical protein
VVSIAGVCDDGCVVGGGRVVKCVLGDVVSCVGYIVDGGLLLFESVVCIKC